jgi:hypothetical protein
LWRRGLVVVAGAGAIAVAAPAVASADVSSLTDSPSSVPAASTSTNLTVTYAFSTAPTAVTTELPPGLLANGTIDGGACLLTPASSSPPVACQVGSGTASPGSVAFKLYLVAAPKSGDIAGLELLVPSLGNMFVTADITTRPASDPDGVGLNFSFSGLSLPFTGLSATFTDVRMPTSCPSTPANVIAFTNGQSTPATAPLTVTGCSSLAYNPSLSATVKKDSGDSGAEVISTVTQSGAATESATKSSVLGFGTSLSPNAGAVAACFASPCQIGTASATSPLLPNPVLSSGTVTLGGTIVAPTLTIFFPALNLSLVGAINLAANSVTFSNEPDFPISSLRVDVTGPSTGGKAFTTSCAAATLTGAFTPWDGNAAVNRSAPIQYQGCPSGGGKAPGKPSASGSLSGLGNGHPKLKFKVTHGSTAQNISSVSIKPSSGLKFKCVKSGKSCKGLSVSGATVKSAKVSGGQLVITLKTPASSVTVAAKGPAITESKSLLTKVNKHQVMTITFSIKVKDSGGKTSVVLLKLKA